VASAGAPTGSNVRVAAAEDATAIGLLLHEFNSEYGDYTPGAGALAARVRELLEREELTVLLAGEGPDGLAVLRFRPAIFTRALECYLAELYVRARWRRQGLGRALMLAAIDVSRTRGADRIELGTSEEDEAARALYERLGFRNREHRPGGPVMYFYELEL
jgi:ribosomal protein S18 acetylase RimI-like enzyme